MYAVIKAGGHQYKVQEGDKITIDKMVGNEGDQVTFDNVLMIGGKKATIGAPLVNGASVEATIQGQGHGRKIIVFKYKRRKNYRRTKGHKQPLTTVKITKINATN